MKFLKNIFDEVFLWTYKNLDETQHTTLKLNPITLSFPKEFETTFLSHYGQSSKWKMTAALMVGAIFYSLFFFLDYLLVPEFFINFLVVRLAVTWTFVGSTIFYIVKGKNDRLKQTFVSLTAIIVAITIIYFIVLAYPKLNNSYYVGIIIIYYWSYSFLKLRFVWATLTGITTFFVYQIVVLTVIELDFETYIITSSFLLGTNFVGMIISYSLEYYSRKEYFQNFQFKKSLESNVSLLDKISESDKVIGQAEQRLMLQSKALESAANSIAILNREGNIIWVNKAFSVLSGYSEDEVIGKNPRILKSGKHSNDFYKNLWSTVLNGRVWSGEIMNKKKNGDNYYEEMVITPVIDDDKKKLTHFIAIKQDITLRKDMEDELFESEKRLRGLFENASMGIYRSTLSGKLLMANYALLKMLGYQSEEELKEQNLTSTGYIDSDQREKFIKEISEKGSLIGFVSEWKKRDGKTIFIRESARADFDENGEMIFEGTVEDITLSIKAQAELQSSSDRLQAVFDNLYDAIIIHDINGKITSVNNKVLDFFNISMDEALSTNIKELITKHKSFKFLEERWNKVLNNNATFKFEAKAKRPKQNYTFDVDVFLSKINLGNESFVLTNLRDITEQKSAQQALRMTKHTVDYSSVLVFWHTKDAKFTYANTSACDKLGYKFEELLSLKIYDVDPLWDKESWEKDGLKVLQSGKARKFETIFRRKNGKEFPVEITSNLSNFEGEEVFVVYATDITNRKIAAEELINAKDKAEQSDKLKSDFLAGMSHEIRTPINTILNFVSLIRTDIGDNMTEDVSESFEMIDNGSRRLIRTIDSIINMSQLQTGSYDVKEEMLSVAEDILAPLYTQFKIVADQNKLDFELNSDGNQSTILGDQYTLTQLFINLIENAIKYTIVGKVTVDISSDDSKIKVDIIDTGVGMSEEFIPTLFNPFVQEEMGYTRSFDGNGLGLALVAKYLELNNSTIQIKSKKGVGSTFSVIIPKPTVKQFEVYNALKVLN